MSVVLLACYLRNCMSVVLTCHLMSRRLGSLGSTDCANPNGISTRAGDINWLSEGGEEAEKPTNDKNHHTVVRLKLKNFVLIYL